MRFTDHRILLGGLLAMSVAACTTVADTPVSVAVEPQTEAPEVLDVEVHEGDFATVQKFTTPGGISVWLVEEPSIPILSLRMAWQTGTVSDPDGLKGLTDAVVYLMNEGAGELDSQAFMTRMEELNMSFGCSADQTSTYCNAQMLVDNLDESMDLIGLAYSEPRFDQGPFDRYVRETEVVLETRQTNPSYLARRARIEALYPDHPFAREITEDSVAALTREAALAHKDSIMTRDAMIVTAVGAVDPETLAPLVDGMVANLPEGAAMTAVPPVDMAPPPEAPLTVELPQPQSLVQFYGASLTRDNPDYYPLILANHIFGGGGFGSRLMDELRVARGLTYGVSSSIDPDKYLSTFSGSGQTKNESAGEFLSVLKAEMTRFVEDGATQDEVDAAKAYLIGSYPLGFDSNAKIAGNLMSLRLNDLPIDYLDERAGRIEGVSLEDINRVAADYFGPERFAYIIVGEPEGLEE